MSLIVDGVRSIRRKWFADKKLAHIKAIGVQSKTLIWDGFVFRVSWQDDIVNVRHIMAPMGALVISSGAGGFHLYAAETWLGPFSAGKPVYGYANFPESGFVPEYAYERAQGMIVAKVVPVGDGMRAHPTLHPVGYTEDIVVSFSATLENRPELVESTIGLFEHNGQQTAISKIVHCSSIGTAVPKSTLFVLPWSGGFRAIRSHWSIYEWYPDDSEYPLQKILASHWTIRSKGDGRIYVLRGGRVEDAVPPGLRPFGRQTPALGLGAYAYTPALQGGAQHFQAFKMTSGSYWDHYPFFEDENQQENPLTRSWKLLYLVVSYPEILKAMDKPTEWSTLEDGLVVASVDSAQFLPLLDKMSGGIVLTGPAIQGGGNTPVEYEIDGEIYNEGGVPYDIENGDIQVDWENAAAMLRNIFCHPNHMDYFEPHDSVMFHSADSVFSWSRWYGAVEITSTGILPVDLTMPDVVLDKNGVRPLISYAGNGLYCCVCDQVGERVLAVYMGTPFDTDETVAEWTEIPLVTEEWGKGVDNEADTSDDGHVLFIRPALITPERVVLLAVTRDMLGVDSETGDAKARYMLAYADGVVNDEALPLLKFLSEIPVADEAALQFDAIFFGNGEYTKLLREYPSPPAVVPHRIYRPAYDYPRVGEY